MMAKHKPHLEIAKSGLSPSNPSSKIFTPHRHDTSSLSTLLVANSKHRSEALTAQQQTAMSRLETSHLLDITKNHRYTRVEILRAYFSFFNDLFFFGSLVSRCGLRFYFKKASEERLTGLTILLKKEQRVFQKMKGKEYEKRRVVIMIFLRENESGSRDEMLMDYLGTLLHEMIHAFLMCWTCDHEGCSNAKDIIGEGHGPVWQDIAYALETAARDHSFSNLELRLRREEALAAEAHRAGRWPGGDELAKWNVSERDFLAKYQASENIEEAELANEIAKIGGRRLIWEGLVGFESEEEASLECADSGFEPLRHRRLA